MVDPGTSTIVATQNASAGQPVARVRSGSDIWVSFGSTPDATDGTRAFVPANVDYDFFVASGDKMAWILAQ